MDLLENPFHILGATTRDKKHKITDLADDCRLLSDANECTDAESTLKRPQNRIAAEIAWLPGVDPEHIDSLLKQLDSPHQNLLNIIDIPPLARANLLTAGLSRLSTNRYLNLMEWILAIAYADERINAEEVRVALNEERSISGFPQIVDLSVISDEIQKQKRYYTQTLSSAINSLSLNERARIITLTLETVISNDNNRCPILIDDLVKLYEVEVGDDLEKKQKIIEAHDEKLRVMVDAKNPDSTLQPIVNQLIQTVKEWDTIAQPIQLSKNSRGERHTDSFEIASRVQKLAVHLFNEYLKYNISLQLLNMLLEVFAEVPEIVEQITIDKRNLEKQIHEVKGIEKFQEINTQVEKLKEAADAKKPDDNLAPMVNELIQTVKTWDPTTQPNEANEAVAFTVRSIAIHLWNEHQKLNFAIELTDVLIDVFTGVNKVVYRLVDDKRELSEIDRERKRMVEAALQKADSRITFEEVKGYGCLIVFIIGIIVLLLQQC